MATYKGIKGVKVVTKTSDPTASESEATVWYNSTGDALKYTIASAGAWAAGDAINQTRWGGIGSGIQTAALYTAGRDAGSSGDETESYNGSSWTAKNAVNTPRAFLGAANQAPNTASIVFGGSNPGGTKYALTETWDGTNWTETADMLTAREVGGGAGAVSTAALAISGYTTTYVTNVEEWNGTSWTAGTAVTTGRRHATGGGTTTDALFVGGQPGFSTDTEVWNGATWTEVANMDEGKNYMGSGITSGSSGIVFGGDTGGPGDDKTEIWDGTAWTEVAALATPREGVSGCGTAALAMDFGGYVTPPGAYPTATEVWNDPVYTIKTVTVS